MTGLAMVTVVGLDDDGWPGLTHARMTGSLALGYREATALRDSPLVAAGTRVRAHGPRRKARMNQPAGHDLGHHGDAEPGAELTWWAGNEQRNAAMSGRSSAPGSGESASPTPGAGG
jgi:hypothetical protein